MKGQDWTVFSDKYLWWTRLSVDCSSQSATCAVTEVNESGKCCENAAVNHRPRTSVRNYPRADESVMSTRPSSVFWQRWHSAENCWLLFLLVVISVGQRKSWVSFQYSLRGKQNAQVCWASGGDGGGVVCFLLQWDHHGWTLTSCHGCWASWQKGLGSHPWSLRACWSLCSCLPVACRMHAALNWALLFSHLICTKLHLSRKLPKNDYEVIR